MTKGPFQSSFNGPWFSSSTMCSITYSPSRPRDPKNTIHLLLMNLWILLLTSHLSPDCVQKQIQLYALYCMYDVFQLNQLIWIVASNMTCSKKHHSIWVLNIAIIITQYHLVWYVLFSDTFIFFGWIGKWLTKIDISFLCLNFPKPWWTYDNSRS